jgi:hypothetical protein
MYGYCYKDVQFTVFCSYKCFYCLKLQTSRSLFADVKIKKLALCQAQSKLLSQTNNNFLLEQETITEYHLNLIYRCSIYAVTVNRIALWYSSASSPQKLFA